MRVYVLMFVALIAGCRKQSTTNVTDDTDVAKMTALTDQMCACKDKPCADQVYEIMIKISEQLEATERDRSETAKTKLARLERSFIECLAKARSAPLPVKSAIDTLGVPTSKDVDGLVREATEWAARKDAAWRIRAMTFAYVDRGGVLDPKFGDIDIYFGRIATEKRRVGTPMRSAEHYCYGLTVWYTHWKQTQEPCLDTVDYVPRCSVVAIWNRALERNPKVDAEGVATITFDAAAKAWRFLMTDEPTDLHVDEKLDDDCPFAVER